MRGEAYEAYTVGGETPLITKSTSALLLTK